MPLARLKKPEAKLLTPLAVALEPKAEAPSAVAWVLELKSAKLVPPTAVALLAVAQAFSPIAVLAAGLLPNPRPQRVPLGPAKLQAPIAIDPPVVD
jgi:hypothetical protein